MLAVLSVMRRAKVVFAYYAGDCGLSKEESDEGRMMKEKEGQEQVAVLGSRLYSHEGDLVIKA